MRMGTAASQKRILGPPGVLGSGCSGLVAGAPADPHPSPLTTVKRLGAMTIFWPRAARVCSLWPHDSEKTMTRPAPIYIAFVLLLSTAANLALLQYQAQKPSRYLIGGYRGAVILSIMAAVVLLFPKAGRWIAGIFFAFCALAFLPPALRSSSVGGVVSSLVYLVAAILLFRAKLTPDHKV